MLLRKRGDFYCFRRRKAAAMQLNPLNFMKRIGSEITLSAIRATDHRNILDDQQLFALAVGFCYLADSCSLFPADITYQRLIIFLHRVTTELPPPANQ